MQGGRKKLYVQSLGLSLGVANVWRLTYSAYFNGGGSFLLAYLLLLGVIAVPMLFLELSLGQYLRTPACEAFGKMAPLFKGLGYAMLLVLFMEHGSLAMLPVVQFAYIFAVEYDLEECNLYYEQYPDCYTAELAASCGRDDVFYNGACVSRHAYCLAHNYWGGYEGDNCIEENNATTPFQNVLQESAVSPWELYLDTFSDDLRW